MSEDHAIRALLVDYGGVMTTSMGNAFVAFCVEHGIEPDRFKDVIDAAYGGGDPDGMIARLETGRIELDEFEVWLATELSGGTATSLDATGLKQRIFSGMEPDQHMTDAVRRAHAAGVRTALVSNSWGATGYERDRFPELFDAVVVSGEIGMRKPDPDIFLHTAKLLGLDPEACVFVDDLLQNVEGARAVGMTGIVHRNAELTIPELEELLGVTLR